MKLLAPDGKRRLADAVDHEGVIKLAKSVPNNKAMAFLDWFTYSDNSIDGQSRKKAYTFWESNIIAGYCGYEMTNHHHALADAEACAIIAKQIL